MGGMNWSSSCNVLFDIHMLEHCYECSTCVTVAALVAAADNMHKEQQQTILLESSQLTHTVVLLALCCASPRWLVGWVVGLLPLVDLPEIKGGHRKFRNLVSSYIGMMTYFSASFCPNSPPSPSVGLTLPLHCYFFYTTPVKVLQPVTPLIIFLLSFHFHHWLFICSYMRSAVDLNTVKSLFIYYLSFVSGVCPILNTTTLKIYSIT